MEELPQGGEQYHMVNPPHTNFMMREQIPWQIAPPPGNDTIWQMFPMKEYHIMVKLPPSGRNPMAELTQGEIIPYGKASPSVANLL